MAKNSSTAHPVRGSMGRRPLPAPASSPAGAGFRPVATVAALAAAFWLAGPLRAQPVGGQAIAGQASFATSGANLVVTTGNAPGANHSAINWQSFSVPAGSITQFIQPSATSTSINRVLGADPSAIFGTLRSNGRLVLVNPAGIAVGQGAVVDTAAFTASTLRMTELDAQAGRLIFADGAGAGALSVQGQVLARHGDVVLIGPRVQVGAQALVQAPNGATVLAAGQKVAVTGRGLEGIHFDVQAAQDEALNLGRLEGDAVGLFAGTLNHSGVIQAVAATAEGGKVVLRATGDAWVGGAVRAGAAAGHGGRIDVFGQRLGLTAGAALDASGAQGGGSIRVGGDFQGRNADVPNAQRTYVDAQATIKADAVDQGNGGRIIVWADEQTQAFGAVSARGGAAGGDGGFVEVSGKQRLQFAAQVDTRAPQGRTGTLLLDPDDISVDPSGPGTTAYTAPVAFADAPATLSLDVATINSATSNVVLQANNDIGINAPINIANAGTSFTAQAGRYLSVGSAITTNGGAVTLRAGDAGSNPVQNESGLYIQAPITTNGGAVNLSSRLSDVGGTSLHVAAAVDAGAGAVNVDAQEIWVGSTGSIARSGAGDLVLESDRVRLEGAVGSAGGRVVVRSAAANPGRAVSLGGTDDSLALSLDAAELALITAPTLVVGWSDRTGGILIEGPVTLAPAQVQALSLINGSAGAITQTGALTASQLNADAGTVTLTNAGNQFGTLSGRGSAGAFQATSGTALVVDTVDGQAGITATGAVAVTGAGVTVASGRTISSGGAITVDGGGSTNAIALGGSTLYSSGGGAITVGNAGNVTLGAVQTGVAGSLSVSGSGNLDQDSALTVGGGVTAMMGGAIDLSHAANSIGSLGSMSSGGGGIVVREGNDGLTITGPVNAGAGAVDIAAAGGGLTVAGTGTVSGGSLTLAALAGNLTIAGSVTASTGGIALSAPGEIRLGAGASPTITAVDPVTLSAPVAKVNGGTVTLGTSITSGNPLDVAAGTLVIASDLTIPKLAVTGGTVTGAGALSVPTELTWSGGSLGGTGGTVLSGNSVISGAVSLARGITNSGTLALSGSGMVTLAGGSIVNGSAGVVDIQVDGGFGGSGGVIDNAGLFKKSAGTGTSAVSGVTFSNTGTLAVESGTLQFGNAVFASNAGTLAVAAGATLDNGNTTLASSGLIEGSGTLDLGTATLDNTGALKPGGYGTVGTLNIVAGQVNFAAGSTLYVDVTDAASHDVLAVSGGVNFDPAMTLSPQDVSASYAAGTPFDVVRSASGSITGTVPAATGFNNSFAAGSGYQALRMAAASDVPAPPAPPPPPAPAPAPAPKPPAPAPVSSRQDAAQQAVANQVVVFAQLFEQEAQQQEDDDQPAGKDAIVITDTQCKP